MPKKMISALIVVIVVITAVWLFRQQKSETSPTVESAVAQAADVQQPPASATPATSTVSAAGVPGKGQEAISKAASANQHLFLFFYEKDDQATQAARKTFENSMGKLADRAMSLALDRTAASEQDLVAKYGLAAAPMPLILVVAPNGAITGGFPASQMTEQKLQGALASTAMQQCLKALQERKLVILCAQNSGTKFNSEAMSGVQAFKNDVRFSRITEIVKVDPADTAEVGFMAQLQVNPKTDQAATVVLAPPGAIIASFNGATDKDTLFAAVLKGCSSGSCGPNGCN